MTKVFPLFANTVKKDKVGLKKNAGIFEMTAESIEIQESI